MATGHKDFQATQVYPRMGNLTVDIASIAAANIQGQQTLITINKPIIIRAMNFILYPAPDLSTVIITLVIDGTELNWYPLQAVWGGAAMVLNILGFGIKWSDLANNVIMMGLSQELQVGESLDVEYTETSSTADYSLYHSTLYYSTG